MQHSPLCAFRPCPRAFLCLWSSSSAWRATRRFVVLTVLSSPLLCSTNGVVLWGRIKGCAASHVLWSSQGVTLRMTSGAVWHDGPSSCRPHGRVRLLTAMGSLLVALFLLVVLIGLLRARDPRTRLMLHGLWSEGYMYNTFHTLSWIVMQRSHGHALFSNCVDCGTMDSGCNARLNIMIMEMPGQKNMRVLRQHRQNRHHHHPLHPLAVPYVHTGLAGQIQKTSHLLFNSWLQVNAEFVVVFQ